MGYLDNMDNNKTLINYHKLLIISIKVNICKLSNMSDICMKFVSHPNKLYFVKKNIKYWNIIELSRKKIKYWTITQSLDICGYCQSLDSIKHFENEKQAENLTVSELPF